MGRSANQSVYRIGRYRVFEEYPGEDSRMYIRSVTEKQLNKAIARERKRHPAQKCTVEIESEGRRFVFTQGNAGAKRLLCREVKD